MPKLAPIKRKILIRNLYHFGFHGPYPGSNHQFMKKDALKVFIPNPHSGDIGADFLKRILRQAGISIEEWEKL